MPQASGPKQSAKENLIFAYDIGDVKNSYVGEPTTNIAYATNNNLNSGGNWWVNGGSNVFSDNDTIISKPNISNINTSNLYVFSSLVTGGGSNQQLGTSIIPISPSTTYSFSIWYYFTGTVMAIYPYIRTATNNDSIGTFSYNGNTDGTTWPKNQWILLKATGTTQANETGIYMSSYTGNAVGDKVYYFGYQVEQKSHCTPLVLGTRSATQGLLPIIGNSTIDLTNVSFDSNAQIVFDGTDDYVSFSTITNTIYTIEFWYRMGGNDATYGYFASSGDNGLAISEGGTLGGLVYGQFYYYNGTTINLLGMIPSTTNWNHICVLINTSTNNIQIYGNGSQLSTTTVTNMSTSISNIGRYITANNNFLKGNLAIYRIYNSALTATEIQQNYKSYKTRFKLS